MGLNDVTKAERVHIGIFGNTNAGKSSLINAMTNQNLSIVSEHKGTTTDPVSKAMEILPLGAVLITDTPGIDDEGELGKQRVNRAIETLNSTDIAVLTVDSVTGLTPHDKRLIDLFKEKQIPYIIAYNKSDLNKIKPKAKNEIAVSATSKDGIKELRELIASLATKDTKEKKLIGDLLNVGDRVILVTPIDESAPKGRIILPQVQVLREVLDAKAIAEVLQPEQLAEALKAHTTAPRLVITDSQVFREVNSILPENIPLTSFSVLFANYKGILKTAVEGVQALNRLKDGDKVLISEGCTHHRQCNDIGTVKLPKLIKKYTGKNLNFEFTSGGSFIEDLKPYSLIVHCGGCMLSEKEVQNRMIKAQQANIPFTNYGTLISYINGILEKSIAFLSTQE